MPIKSLNEQFWRQAHSFILMYLLDSIQEEDRMKQSVADRGKSLSHPVLTHSYSRGMYLWMLASVHPRKDIKKG